ncbi:hypothetical protein HanXRQr2_Chr17g0785281 [Helianthus annuus]|uniref:Uncharacterized protein n=1 Tax=Helianthus annuus TaxID=4232 RepID=A0A9K3DEJ4_HELAN|nr:hypothetical protein HanXRQr2_Chr17g0785281 [Helianthus annuus]KAJ0811664.1 hypothetical protein HanPSC8_Chr17g0753251 [Helianthus annuus]
MSFSPGLWNWDYSYNNKLAHIHKLKKTEDMILMVLQIFTAGRY